MRGDEGVIIGWGDGVDCGTGDAGLLQGPEQLRQEGRVAPHVVRSQAPLIRHLETPNPTAKKTCQTNVNGFVVNRIADGRLLFVQKLVVGFAAVSTWREKNSLWHGILKL